MYNRRYEKIFIMLRQEQAGFGLGQRAPWGSGILELKNGLGYLTIQIQGLQKMSGEAYTVYLVGGQKESQKEISCGVLSVEENGRASLFWEFSPEEIEQETFALEDIHTIAIILGDRTPLCVPLCGYIAEKVQWKKWFETTKEVEQQSVSLDIVEEVKQEETKSAGVQAAEVASMQMENPDYHGNFRGLLAKFKAEIAELQEAGIFSTKEMEQIERAGRMQSRLEQEISAELVEDNHEEEIEEVRVEEVCAFEKEEIQPQNIAGVEYIGLEEVILLDGIPTSWKNEYFFLLAMKRYGSFLWYQDEWLLGVPAMVSDEEMARFFGFTYFWQPENQEFGYWMMELVE